MSNSNDEYTRPPRKQFAAKGIDLNSPPDVQKESGTYPILYNVISYLDGTIEVRPALSDRYASYVPWGGKTPVHSARRLNDHSSSKWALLYGVGDALGIERSTATGTLVQLETGYDTNPLSFSIYRPASSPSPYAYIANANRQRKIDCTLTATKQIGLQRPNRKPLAIVDTGAYTTIDLFEANTGWSTPTAGASIAASANRVNTTTTGFTQYDDAAGSLVVLQPASMANIGVGTILTIADSLGTADHLVIQVNKAGPSTTIKKILYDDQSNAYCVLTIPSREAQVNSLIYNTTRTAFARVTAVIGGPDGTTSLEFTPPSANWADGDTVQLVASFVYLSSFYPVNAPTVGGAITSKHVPFTTAASGSTYFDKTTNVDLSQFLYLSTNYGATLDDYIHISLRPSTPDKVSEIKVYLDVDSVTNDFTRNYYVYSISPSDFTSVAKSTQSAIDNRQLQIRRSILDGPIGNRRFFQQETGPTPGDISTVDPSGGIISTRPPDGSTPDQPSRDQLTPGDNQFSEVTFPFAAMTRVGSDDSRGPKDIKAIRIEVITTAVVVLDVDSWILHGGFALDTLDNLGYLYAYRFRDSSTGSVSDISPASRGMVYPRRQRVFVKVESTGAPTEVDKIDIFRIGGSLDVWSYVGTTPIGITSFYDTFSDDAVRASESVLEALTGFDPDIPDLQPFPILDTPKSGTISSAAGTIVASSSAFDIRWAPGVQIVLGNIPTTIYRVVQIGGDTGNNASRLEVLDNLNSLGAVSWEIAQPLLLGQPLGVWANEDFHGHSLACGDAKNPGVLYYSKSKNFDVTALRNRLEITSGSEVLQNIFVFFGRAGVFSNTRLFYLEYDPLNPAGIFQPYESPQIKGLLARWAMAVGRRGVAWLADDGIYMFGADTGVAGLKAAAGNMTVGPLRPLFPFGSKSPVDTNGITAPYIPNPVGAEERHLRLSFFGDDDSLLFFYRDVNGNHKCIRYDFNAGGWFPHVYGAQDASGANTRAAQAVFAYTEEGRGVSKSTIVGTDNTAGGRVMTVGGSSDNGTDAGTSIPCIVQTYQDDFDDPRAEKQIGDIELDVDPDNLSLTVTPMFNNTTLGTPVTISGTRPDPPSVIDLTSGSGVFARNVGLKITWTNTAGHRPRLYHWQPSYLSHPENSLLRATNRHFVDKGMLYCRGFWIDADTSGSTRSINVQYTDHLGTQQSLTISTINHAVKSRIFYPLATPVYLSTWRFLPTDGNKWRFYGGEPFGDPAPPFSTEGSPITDDGEIGNKFLQGVELDIDTHGTSISIQILGDEGQVLETLTGVTANGRTQIPFAFNPAVYTHLMRVVPLSPAHLFGVKWFWQSDAEQSAYFETQDITFDLRGYGHMREAWIAYRSASAIITPTLIADGTAISNVPTLPTSIGYTKQRITIPARQWKSLKMYLSSTQKFYLYKRDCEFWIKPWSSTGDYEIVQPFGFSSRDRGVAII